MLSYSIMRGLASCWNVRERTVIQKKKLSFLVGKKKNPEGLKGHLSSIPSRTRHLFSLGLTSFIHPMVRWPPDCSVFFFFLHHTACGILLPWPGIEPVPPAWEVWSLNHWATREVLHMTALLTLPMGLHFCFSKAVVLMLEHASELLERPIKTQIAGFHLQSFSLSRSVRDLRICISHKCLLVQRLILWVWGPHSENYSSNLDLLGEKLSVKEKKCSQPNRGLTI